MAKKGTNRLKRFLDPASPPSHIYQKAMEKIWAGCADWNDCDECKSHQVCEAVWGVIYMWSEVRWEETIKNRRDKQMPSHVYQWTLRKIRKACAKYNDCKKCKYNEMCPNIWNVVSVWSEKRWTQAISYERTK